MNEQAHDRAAIYVRTATSASSVEQQQRACLAFADANNLTVVDVYVDSGISGTDHDRPALQRLVDDAAPRRIDVVIVEAPDRLARDAAALLEVVETLSRHGVRVASVATGAALNAGGTDAPLG